MNYTPKKDLPAQEITEALNRDSTETVFVFRVDVPEGVTTEDAFHVIRALSFPEGAVSRSACAALSLLFAQSQVKNPRFPITSPEGSLAELRDLKILRAFMDEHMVRVRLNFPSHLT